MEMLVRVRQIHPMEAIKAATSGAVTGDEEDGWETRCGGPSYAADVIVVDGVPRDIKVLVCHGAITEAIKAGKRIDISTLIPEHSLPGEKVALSGHLPAFHPVVRPEDTALPTTMCCPNRNGGSQSLSATGGSAPVSGAESPTEVSR